MTEIRTAANVDAHLGECPLWSVDEQCLYWVDIDGRAVHRHHHDGDEVRSVPGRPGSIMLTDRRGTLLVAMEHELMVLDWASGELTLHVALEAEGTGNRLNDGRCDPAGRVVVGSMYEDTGAGRTTGMLHQVDAGGRVRRLREGIGVSNGVAFDADRHRMYFADSPTGEIRAFDYDLETGALDHERLFFDYGDLAGKPDGGCVDADGGYWSACVHGWAVIRITPDGRLDRRIELPVGKPTMPAFGGPDLRTLYVTSIGRSAAPVEAHQRDGFAAGALLAIETEVAGVAEPRFPLG